MISIRALEHLGHRGLELADRAARMIVLSSIGPRIAWFGPHDGDNLLYWDATGERGHGSWRLHGGHRLWLTRPLADESEETYEPDHWPCRVEPLDDGVRLTALPSGLAIEKSLAIRAQEGAWTIEHQLRNVGAFLWSGGAWALTCTLPRPETIYRVPLGGGPAAWDVATIVIPLRWGGIHGSRLDDPQIALTADAMELRPHRDEAKRMVLAPQGVIEMRDPERGVFRKRTVFERDASYPLGTNLAVYLGPDRFMVELETMSPLRTLVPGDTLSHVETWTLEGL